MSRQNATSSVVVAGAAVWGQPVDRAVTRSQSEVTTCGRGALATFEPRPSTVPVAEILGGMRVRSLVPRAAEQAIWSLTGYPGNLAFTRRGVEQLGSSLGS